MESDASTHHDELRFTLHAPGGQAVDPMSVVEPAALQAAIEAALGGQHPLATMYVNDEQAILARIPVTDVAFLHGLRDKVLEGRFAVELTDRLRRLPSSVSLDVKVDLSAFAERYESSVLHLDKLTKHQQLKLLECKGHQSVRVEAPAGGGKTFIALHEMLGVLQLDSAEESEKAAVLFVAPHEALAVFVASWIGTRLGKYTRDEMLRRLWVLFLPFDQGLKQASLSDEGKISFEQPSADEKPKEFRMVVVDEGHHIYNNAALRETVESHVAPSTRRIVLADVSQSLGQDIAYPPAHRVELTEVVRCSKRIVQAASVFQIGGERKLHTQCHHRSDGPPVKSFLFELAASSSSVERFRAYAERVMAALEHIANLFPRLELTNRVAILVPDAPFLDGLKPQLMAEFQARGRRSDQTPGQQYILIEARGAAAALRGRGRSSGGEALVLDTIGNFDGLERLIVIAVGLDAPLDKESDDAFLETRSRLYRALTRAHMLAMVVNEAVRGGWLEWLNLIKLKEGKFDREAELARMKADAAEAEVKRRLEAIDKALEAAMERRARAVPAADTAAREHSVAPGTLTEEEHAYVRSLIDRAVTTGGQSLEAAADAQLDSWCTLKDALERALRMQQAMTPSSAETSELLLRVAKQVSRAPTASLDAVVQEAIRELQTQASTRQREFQMKASRRQRDICIAQLCDADEGLHTNEKRMVERRAKRGGDGAEVAVQSAIRELRQDEALIAESVARLTGLSDQAAQQLQQEALGSVYEGGEEIPAAVDRLFQEVQARAAVQEAAVQNMSGEERSLLTKAVQVAIGRGEDSTMATAREVARHQQVRTEVQGALRAKASLLGPKFDARSLEGRVFMAVLRGSPVAEEVAKHVKEFQEGLITEQTVWDTGANSTSQPDTLKFNPLQQERTSLVGGEGIGDGGGDGGLTPPWTEPMGAFIGEGGGPVTISLLHTESGIASDAVQGSSQGSSSTAPALPRLPSSPREVITLCLDGDVVSFDDSREDQLLRKLVVLLRQEVCSGPCSIRIERPALSSKMKAKIGTKRCCIRVEVDEYQPPHHSTASYSSDASEPSDSRSDTSVEDDREDKVKDLTKSSIWPSDVGVGDIDVVFRRFSSVLLVLLVHPVVAHVLFQLAKQRDETLRQERVRCCKLGDCVTRLDDRADIEDCVRKTCDTEREAISKMPEYQMEKQLKPGTAAMGTATKAMGTVPAKSTELADAATITSSQADRAAMHPKSAVAAAMEGLRGAWSAITEMKMHFPQREYLDRPVTVAAFAPTDPEAPRILRFVLCPAHEGPLPDNLYMGFCKVGEDNEVTVVRGKAVRITVEDHPELGVTFAPWCNTRQSEMIPCVVLLEPSSSHSSLLMAVISQPGVVSDQRQFPLMLPTAAAAVPEASRASSASSSAQSNYPVSAPPILFSRRDYPAHTAQILMLPDTWDAEAGADVERPRLVEVPSLVGAAPNPEFEHVASLLAKGLPGASILGLKRVQNARLWRKYNVECHEIALKNGGQSNERELWHSTGNTPADVVCMSEHGFDPTYSIGSVLRAGTDGNKYGIGEYFYEHALYSDVMRPTVAQEGGKEIVLAKVVLGNLKDYGTELAPDLLREPRDERTGIAYDSWSGTENDLRGVTEIEAVRLSGSPSAKKRAQLLVDEGHKYGRQYIVCRYQKAYPAYVVRYEVLLDAFERGLHTQLEDMALLIDQLFALVDLDRDGTIEAAELKGALETNSSVRGILTALAGAGKESNRLLEFLERDGPFNKLKVLDFFELGVVESTATARHHAIPRSAPPRLGLPLRKEDVL